MGRLGAVLGRLGVSWGRLGASPRETIRKTTHFHSENAPPNLKDQARTAGRARFLKNRVLKLTSLFALMLVPFCLHSPHSYGVLGAALGVLGAAWGVSGASWGASWRVLGRLRSVLERLGASWGDPGTPLRRFSSELHPRTPKMNPKIPHRQPKKAQAPPSSHCSGGLIFDFPVIALI